MKRSHQLGPIYGYRKDGRPIYMIRGGSEPPNQPPAGDPPAGDPPKADALDEFGQSLGFPQDTAVKDMEPKQQAAYWTHEASKQRDLSKRIQKQREEAERALAAQNGGGSGTVRDQQQQGQGTQTATVDENKVKREAAKDAALATLTATLALRGKNSDERDELLDLVDPAKFVTADGNIDAAKVKTYVDRVAPAGNDQQGNGTGGSPGQGRFTPGGQSKRELGETEAQRRFANQKDQPNRGALGGLRR